MFRSARIKLTTWYLLIIMSVTLMFSVIMYVGVNGNTQRALELHERRMETRLREFGRLQNMPPRFQEPLNLETAREIRSRTIALLAVVNITVLIISGLLGYVLAGETLRPIELMADKQKKFIADAAHELKTPLTAMKTNLEVTLRNTKLDIDSAKRTLEETIEDVDSLTHLTLSLIKQSKYENLGKVSKDKIINGHELEVFGMASAIEDVIKKLGIKFSEKKITTEINVKDVKVVAEKKEIDELITILLDNAIKFNKKGGKVSISTETKGTNLILKVTDNGHGIPEKDLPHIFDRFYKSDTSRSGHDGFGLGLSIAKEIVNDHKGSIRVEKTGDEGTTMNVVLPIVKRS